MKTKTAAKYPKEIIAANKEVAEIAEALRPYYQTQHRWYKVFDRFVDLCDQRGLPFQKVIEDLRS